MSVEQVRRDVLAANLDLVKKNLVISTWGNVSGYDEDSGLMLIKASGVPYDRLEERHIVAVDEDGNVVDSPFSPSTDTKTHLELYRKFKDKGVRGIVHTHSSYATMWAQYGRDIPCYGTTHCDYFYGDIPCTRLMSTEEIEEDYEKNTGRVILEIFEEGKPDCREMSAVLVHSHGPFCWGSSPAEAVLHAQVLEYVAKMAMFDYMMSNGGCEHIRENIKNKHYSRKFGPDAYYGQRRQI